ncbi:MAG: hypothetical protein AB7R89_33385 [Dehalococcoidia bacterium]
MSGRKVLLTNLPTPNTVHAQEAALTKTDLTEVVRLHVLGNWVEQGYKQVKQALRWSANAVRNDRAMLRHQELHYCALRYCWGKPSGGQYLIRGADRATNRRCADAGGRLEP